jgi:hypothetical protein
MPQRRDPATRVREDTFAARIDGVAGGIGIEASFWSHDRSDDDDGFGSVRRSANRSQRRRRIARQWPERSIGPLGPGGNVRQIVRRRCAEQAGTWNDRRAQWRHRQCHRCAEVTSLAIGVKGTRHVGVISRGPVGTLAGLVHMLVMPDMLCGCDRGLVPAVNRGPSPCKLEGDNGEQQDDQPMTHCHKF